LGKWRPKCLSHFASDISLISDKRQQCRKNTVTTTLSQIKIRDFSGERFKAFELLYISISAMTTQLLSSGEFYKLRYDTIPVKSASSNVSFYTNNSKMPNFELWYSRHKWAICRTKHRESTAVFLWEGVQYLLNFWQLTYAAPQYTANSFAFQYQQWLRKIATRLCYTYSEYHYKHNSVRNIISFRIYFLRSRTSSQNQ